MKHKYLLLAIVAVVCTAVYSTISIHHAFSDSSSQQIEVAALMQTNTRHDFSMTGPYGNGTSNIADPSLEFLNERFGYMTYSTVVWPGSVSTAIAHTRDGGRTWSHLNHVNKSQVDIVQINNHRRYGTWRNEVSTLVHDKDNPDSQKRWRMYWHKYFAKYPYTTPDHRTLEYSWIATKTAPQPWGPWSEEVPLFGSGSFPIALDDAVGIPAGQKHKCMIFHTCKPRPLDLNQLHPDLGQYITYTEPGAYRHENSQSDSTLYISLVAIGVHVDSQGVIEPYNDIILLRSPDHGETYEYVATIANAQDAEVLGGQFESSALFMKSGEVYLLAGFSTVGNEGHGSEQLLVRFTNVEEGLLERSTQGAIEPEERLSVQFGGNLGPGDYDEHHCGGIVVWEALPVPPNQTSRFMRLFNTTGGCNNEG